MVSYTQMQFATPSHLFNVEKCVSLYSPAVCQSTTSTTLNYGEGERWIISIDAYQTTRHFISILVKHCAWYYDTICVSFPRTSFHDCRYYDKINTSKKESLHLYEGSSFQIWLLYGDIIATDVCGFFSSTF